MVLLTSGSLKEYKLQLSLTASGFFGATPALVIMGDAAVVATNGIPAVTALRNDLRFDWFGLMNDDSGGLCEAADRETIPANMPKLFYANLRILIFFVVTVVKDPIKSVFLSVNNLIRMPLRSTVSENVYRRKMTLMSWMP
ncbi:MAG TPA: hypothetical protein VGA96_01230 [Fibrella sp.]